MPITAFGHSMLAAVTGHDQTFQLSVNGGPLMAQSCRPFLELRREEVELLRGLKIPQGARVLDYGCGAGRHLAHLRATRADIHCVGIEVCDGLRQHCARAVSAPATFVTGWHQAKGLGGFDLILLMGNGLGVLGGELEARSQLKELLESITPGGCMVIETGNWGGRGYREDILKIYYQGYVDGPFSWGGADRTWVKGTLEALGAQVTLTTSTAPGGFFFFATASITP